MKSSTILSLIVGVIIVFVAGFVLQHYLRKWKKEKDEEDKKKKEEIKTLMTLVTPSYPRYNWYYPRYNNLLRFGHLPRRYRRKK